MQHTLIMSKILIAKVGVPKLCNNYVKTEHVGTNFLIDYLNRVFVFYNLYNMAHKMFNKGGKFHDHSQLE